MKLVKKTRLVKYEEIEMNKVALVIKIISILAIVIGFWYSFNFKKMYILKN